MQSQRNKVKKLNVILILIYFTTTILAMFKIDLTDKLLLGIMGTIFTIFLLFINVKDIKHKNRYSVPLYYYFFVLIIISTIHFSGSYNSILFPSIFFIPFLYSIINFSRKESVAVTIFIMASMWLILMEDIGLNKIYQVMFVSICIVCAQIIIEFLKKDYKINKNQSMFTCGVYIDENKK